jgi:hypothetical protein
MYSTDFWLVSRLQLSIGLVCTYMYVYSGHSTTSSLVNQTRARISWPFGIHCTCIWNCFCMDIHCNHSPSLQHCTSWVQRRTMGFSTALTLSCVWPQLWFAQCSHGDEVVRCIVSVFSMLCYLCAQGTDNGQTSNYLWFNSAMDFLELFLLVLGTV